MVESHKILLPSCNTIAQIVWPGIAPGAIIRRPELTRTSAMDRSVYNAGLWSRDRIPIASAYSIFKPSSMACFNSNNQCFVSNNHHGDTFTRSGNKRPVPCELHLVDITLCKTGSRNLLDSHIRLHHLCLRHHVPVDGDCQNSLRSAYPGKQDCVLSPCQHLAPCKSDAIQRQAPLIKE